MKTLEISTWKIWKRLLYSRTTKRRKGQVNHIKSMLKMFNLPSIEIVQIKRHKPYPPLSSC